MEAFPADRGAGSSGDVAYLREAVPGDPPHSAPSRVPSELTDAATGTSRFEPAEHSDDVVATSEALCDRLGVKGSERDDVVAAARLHDIGKVSVPRHVLEKRGSLSANDWAVIRRHPMVGERILRAVPEMEAAATLVRHSHERWDGGGYPDALAGEDIPLGSRIIFCADAFHAMRCDRPYRPGVPATAALEEIAGCAETQFDPEVVAALCDTASEPPDLVSERQPQRRRRFLPRLHRGRDTR